MSAVAELLASAAARLGGEEARRDAELLLAEVLERSRTWLYTWPEAEVPAAAETAFFRLLARRAAGEPLAYLLGRREFWSLDLLVNEAVLIPRPDTERLVELALERLPLQALTVADLGTGSGAIALALASERPQWQLIGTDRSEAALAVARENAARLGLRNVAFHPGDWSAALPMAVDAMVANPPYIAADDPHLARGDLRFEPGTALVAAEDGLADLAAIVSGAGTKLRAGGWLLLEHGWKQGEAVRALLERAGFEAVSTERDLAGNDRVSLGRLPAAVS